MNNYPKDAALIQVLADRLEKQRLPQALSLKARLDGGDLLTESDIDFLQQAFSDAQHVLPLVDRHPGWQSLTAQVLNLYKQITDIALENEQANRGS